jgi:hypothetical protein
VVPPLVWRTKRRGVLDLASKYLSEAVPRANGGSGGVNARDLPPDGSWTEVPMEAPALRLRGRADVVQRRGGDVVIRDLKTGRVLSEDGRVIAHIERQMRLYGAMAHIVWPDSRVSLVVDHGIEHEVGFSAEQERDVIAWLVEVLDRLPGGRDVDTEPLAKVGAACEGCAHRHICPAYRCAAPVNWRGASPVRMPLDTWGEVLTIAARQDALVDLTIRDSAGRTVKVFGLAAFRVCEVGPGDRIWLFGLRTTDKRGGPDLWQHPHNFLEVADVDPFARAWTVQSFR